MHKTLSYLLLLTIGIAWFWLGASHDLKRVRRVFSNRHYSTLVKNCKDEILCVYETEVDGQKFTVVFIRAANMLMHPFSGCPVMIFDKEGKQIDKTVDSDNDFKFYNKWIKPIANDASHSRKKQFAETVGGK